MVGWARRSIPLTADELEQVHGGKSYANWFGWHLYSGHRIVLL